MVMRCLWTRDKKRTCSCQAELKDMFVYSHVKIAPASLKKYKRLCLGFKIILKLASLAFQTTYCHSTEWFCGWSLHLLLSELGFFSLFR